MHIFLKNIPAKFHPYPTWNYGAWDFFWRRSPGKEQEEEQDDLDEFLI